MVLYCTILLYFHWCYFKVFVKQQRWYRGEVVVERAKLGGCRAVLDGTYTAYFNTSCNVLCATRGIGLTLPTLCNVGRCSADNVATSLSTSSHVSRHIQEATTKHARTVIPFYIKQNKRFTRLWLIAVGNAMGPKPYPPYVLYKLPTVRITKFYTPPSRYSTIAYHVISLYHTIYKQSLVIRALLVPV